MRIKEYVRADDSNPYEKWFNSLNSQAAAKVAVAIARIELRYSQLLWIKKTNLSTILCSFV